MALEVISTTGPTIMVSSAAELTEAYELLSTQPGGGTILLEGGSYGDWWYNSNGLEDGSEPVVIKSANDKTPAHFTEIYLRDVDNIRIESIKVDGTELGLDEGKTAEFTIHACSNIQITDSIFTFDSDNAMKGDDITVTERGISIRDSSDILVQNNYIDGHLHGLGLSEVYGVEIIGNEFTNIVGDGIRGGGLNDVTIADNYMHDFFGVYQEITHSDLIQVWGNQNDVLTENLVITGNILMASDAASQSIFIRNEEFGQEGDSTNGYFQNITITDNLIYNGMRHGIHVSDAEGVVVDGNTLIWNPDAQAGFSWEVPKTNDPMIVVRNVIDAEVINNITSDIYFVPEEGTVLTDNQIVTYNNPEDPYYVGNHFVNATSGADAKLSGLFVLSSSPFYGLYGSVLGNFPDDFSDGATAGIRTTYDLRDSYEVTFDASPSLDTDGPTSDNDGYTYYWTFGDGSTAEGFSVTKTFESGGSKGVELEIRLDGTSVANISRNYVVETKEILGFDFENGVVDISDGAPIIIDQGNIVSSDDGKGFLIGDGGKLEIDRGTDGVFNLETFGLTMDLTPTGDEKSGIFLDLKGSMEAWVADDGRFGFELVTDEGIYELISREPVFDDGGTHRLGIAFDGTTGQLELFADGESVSSAEAWGVTGDAEYWGLVFGNTFGDSMDAIIDNVEMSRDPGVAGTLPDIALPAEDPPAEDPLVEEPPAEEPPAKDPAVEDPGGRGAPRDVVESDGSSFFLADLLDMLLSIFGLGKDDEPVSDTAAVSYDTLLDDLVPVTVMLDEEPDEKMDEGHEDDEVGLAA